MSAIRLHFSRLEAMKTMAHSPPLTSTLRPDVIAGLTAAAVVLPKAMAYATVAGLSVSVGLYTAFVPMIVYALLGTSRVLSVSSTTTLAILTGVELATVVPDDDPVKLTIAAATLTALTGALLIGASVLRLGFLGNFISTPVLTGFKAGIGMVIVLDQIPKLLGIHITKQGFFRDLATVAQHVPETSLITLSIGAVTLIALFALERLKPHSAAPLFVVGAGIAASWLFNLSASGVATVGVIPQSLPSLTLPSFDLVGHLLPPAFGIALMSFTETIAAARAFARPSDPTIKANRELLATGAANLLGAFFGAMPAGGGTSQTAVVRSVGGRTQKASLVTAGAAAATMLVLAPFLGFLPQTVLAAIVIVYSVGLINPPEFVAISKIRRMEFTWAIAAFLGVLVFGTLQGIVVAIALSLLGLSSQAVNSKVYVIGRKRGADVLRPLAAENPDDETFDGLLILRPEGRLFFANAQSIGDQIRAFVAEHRPSVLAVDMSRVPDIEYSALQMLVEGERRMAEEGVTVWLVALNPNVLACIRASPLAERLGRERLLFNAREAIRKYQEGFPARDSRSPVGE
jgi:high affinity sulfate transporter 1